MLSLYFCNNSSLNELIIINLITDNWKIAHSKLNELLHVFQHGHTQYKRHSLQNNREKQKEHVWMRERSKVGPGLSGLVQQPNQTYGAFPLHGTVHFWGVFHWVQYLVPGTFLVPPQPRFQAIHTVTKTWRVNSADHRLAGEIVITASLNLRHETR